MRKFLLAGVMALSWHVAFAQPVPTGPEQRANKDQPNGYAGLNSSSLLTHGVFWANGGGGNDSFFDHTVHTDEGCGPPNTIQGGSIYAAQCLQVHTAQPFGYSQAGLIVNFFANANTPGSLPPGNVLEGVATYFAATGLSGGPQIWASALQSTFLSGNAGGHVIEADIFNFMCDPGPTLSPTTCGLNNPSSTILLGGLGTSLESGVFPNQAAILITGETYLFHAGIVFSGTGTFKEQAMIDASNSPTTLQIAGTHTYGIDTAGFSTFTGGAMRVDRNQKIIFDGSVGALGALWWDGTGLRSAGDIFDDGWLLTYENAGVIQATHSIPGCVNGTGSVAIGWNASNGLGEAAIFACAEASGQGGFAFYNVSTAGVPNSTPFFHGDASGDIIAVGYSSAAAFYAPGTTTAVFGNVTHGGGLAMLDPGGPITDELFVLPGVTGSHVAGLEVLGSPDVNVNFSLAAQGTGQIQLLSNVTLASGGTLTIPGMGGGTEAGCVAVDSTGKLIQKTAGTC